MNYCICCHHKMLRHITKRRVYWFCPICYCEMPNINQLANSSQAKISPNKLLTFRKGKRTGKNVRFNPKKRSHNSNLN